MQELMKRQKLLMLKNHGIICQDFLRLNVIYQSHSQECILTDLFLFSASKYICLKAYEFIKKYYENSKMRIHETNPDKKIQFPIFFLTEIKRYPP